MRNCIIQSVSAVDARFACRPARAPILYIPVREYCMATTRLASDSQLSGTGIALTLGDGNRWYAKQLNCWPGRLLVRRSMS